MKSKLSLLLVLLITSLTFTACSDNDDSKDIDKAATFLLGTWRWDDSDAYEITFQKNGKVLWDYKDSRGVKEVSYTYDKETEIVTFVQYRESYVITQKETDKLHLFYVESDGKIDTKHPYTWIRIK